MHQHDVGDELELIFAAEESWQPEVTLNVSVAARAEPCEHYLVRDEEGRLYHLFVFGRDFWIREIEGDPDDGARWK